MRRFCSKNGWKQCNPTESKSGCICSLVMEFLSHAYLCAKSAIHQNRSPWSATNPDPYHALFSAVPSSRQCRATSSCPLCFSWAASIDTSVLVLPFRWISAWLLSSLFFLGWFRVSWSAGRLFCPSWLTSYRSHRPWPSVGLKLQRRGLPHRVFWDGVSFLCCCLSIKWCTFSHGEGDLSCSLFFLDLLIFYYNLILQLTIP